MSRAAKIIRQHEWKQAAADTVVLDFDDRYRRRMAMTGTRGLAFMLDLEEAVVLRGGDALVLDDGRLIEIVAAPEALIEIRCNDALHLIRVAWHLGNRHLPTQIIPKALRIRRDHVIAEMVRGLGARVIEIHTGHYADSEGAVRAAGFQRILGAVGFAGSLGPTVHAGPRRDRDRRAVRSGGRRLSHQRACACAGSWPSSWRP